MECPKPVTLEARERFKKFHEDKCARGGDDRGGHRGGRGRGRGRGDSGDRNAQGYPKREKEASCLAIDISGAKLVSLYSSSAPTGTATDCDVNSFLAVPDFNFCDGTSVELVQEGL